MNLPKLIFVCRIEPIAIRRSAGKHKLPRRPEVHNDLFSFAVPSGLVLGSKTRYGWQTQVKMLVSGIRDIDTPVSGMLMKAAPCPPSYQSCHRRTGRERIGTRWNPDHHIFRYGIVSRRCVKSRETAGSPHQSLDLESSLGWYIACARVRWRESQHLTLQGFMPDIRCSSKLNKSMPVPTAVCITDQQFFQIMKTIFKIFWPVRNRLM